MDDSAQLHRYATTGSEDAFAAVVQRCLPLVYSAALRRVGGDVHRAQDVAQMVFTALARNARALTRHPDLTGWLFTTTRFLAAKAVRGEQRRQARERAAGLDHEIMNASSASDSAAPLHAVLDDVIMELRQLDRQVLLLRFHRGLRLAEIGPQLGATENAVQKRLDRALELLREKLARRGITSTAAAVALAFEAQSAVAVPAGLAAAATTAGLTCGSAAGGFLAGATFMTATKLQLGVAAAAIAAGGAGLVWQTTVNQTLRATMAEHTATVAARATDLSRQLASLTQRADAAEADVARLQQAIDAARAAPAPASRPRLTDARDEMQAALNQAARLAGDGKFQEAVEAYVKLYREVAGRRGSPNHQIVSASLQSLANRYPPARIALHDLRETARQNLQSRPADNDLVVEVATLNDRLGENHASVALYDSLPVGDPGRQAVAAIAHEAFVAARRYPDALVGKSFGNMVREFDLMTRDVAKPSDAALRDRAIKGALTNIESLTGAGKLDDARTLTEKLLAFDNSEATRAALAERVRRATQP